MTFRIVYVIVQVKNAYKENNSMVEYKYQNLRMILKYTTVVPLCNKQIDGIYSRRRHCLIAIGIPIIKLRRSDVYNGDSYTYKTAYFVFLVNRCQGLNKSFEELISTVFDRH